MNRIQTCRKAKPNKGHFALSEIQNLFPERFALISQNVDGLHFQSEMDEKDLFLIHGDLRYMRCSDSCSDELFPIPDKLINRDKKKRLTYDETKLLQCPSCDDIFRPHVLWFDEYYNEKFYKLDTIRQIAKETDLLFVIGTTGTTGLPKQIVALALEHSNLIIEINPKRSLMTDRIEQSKNGFWIKGRSGKILPEIVNIMQS